MLLTFIRLLCFDSLSEDSLPVLFSSPLSLWAYSCSHFVPFVALSCASLVEADYLVFPHISLVLMTDSGISEELQRRCVGGAELWLSGVDAGLWLFSGLCLFSFLTAVCQIWSPAGFIAPDWRGVFAGKQTCQFVQYWCRDLCVIWLYRFIPVRVY